MHVKHIHRKPFPGCYSIESVFKTIASELEAACHVETVTVPQLSKGINPRLANIWWAKRQSADILHVVGDVHYVTLGLPARHTILTIHDCEMLHRTSGLRRQLLKLFWFTLACRNVAAITVVSNATKTELLRHIRFPEGDIHVIPNPVDTTRFAWSPKAFNEAKPVILQIGTRHNKNVERLIAALKQIKCTLVIVGPLTPHQLSLLKQCSIDYISFPTATDEQIVQLYNQADVVSFVSLHEGFGLPIVEAQAVGRPVVTSNCSSMPEVAGSGAVFADPHSIESIRNEILKVIENTTLRQRLIEIGRANSQKFSPQAIAAQYMNLYQKLSETD